MHSRQDLDQQSFLDKIAEEEVHANIPPFRIYTGANMDKRKLYDTIYPSEDIIYPGDNFASFAQKSAAIRQYLNNLEDLKARISYIIASTILDEQDKLRVSLMEELKKASTPDQVRGVLEKMKYGETNSETRQFLSTLIKIEEKNHEVAEEYRKIAQSQNPVFSVIRKLEEERRDSGIETLYLTRAIHPNPIVGETEQGQRERANALSEKYTQSEMLRDLKQLNENLLKQMDGDLLSNESSFDGVSPIFQEYFRRYYTQPDSESEAIFVSPHEKIRRDIELLEKDKNLFKISMAHHQASTLAQQIVVGAFQTKGTPNLSTILPLKDAVGNAPNNKAVEISSADMRKAIERGMFNMDEKLLTKEMRERIMFEVVNHFCNHGKGALSGALEMIDMRYGNRIEGGVPPGARIEEEFQKVLEDSIYNVIMKENGGEELFLEVDEDLRSKYGEIYEGHTFNPDQGVINVSENVFEERYEPIGMRGGKHEKLAKDATALYNLHNIFTKVDKGDLTKEEARKAIKATATILDETQKQSLIGNLNSFYNKKKLDVKKHLGQSEIRQLSDIDDQAGDFVTMQNARKFYHYRYGGSMMSNFFTTLGIRTKSELSLFACLEKASNPMISNRSQSSETGQCMQEYAKEVDQSVSGIHSGLDSNFIAAFGFSFILVFYLGLKRGQQNEIYTFNILQELDRARAIGFTKGASDPEEKEFRRKAIVTSRNGVDEGIVDKEFYSEYLYRTMKAHHDLQSETNPHLMKNRSESVRNILLAKTLEDNAKETQKSIRKILEDSHLKKDFNEFLAYHNKSLVAEYEKEMKALKEDFGDAKDVGDLYKSLIVRLDTMKLGLRKGGVDIITLTEHLQDFDDDIKKAMENMQFEMERAAKLLHSKKERAELIAQGGVEGEYEELKEEYERLVSEIRAITQKQSALESILESLFGISSAGTSFSRLVHDLRDSTEENIRRVHLSRGLEVPEGQDLEIYVKNALSQSFSYGDADEEGELGFRLRYSGTNAEYALIQDLELMERWNSYVHLNENDRYGLKNHKEGVTSTILALKTIQRESYLSAKTIEDGDLSREEAMQKLFREHSGDIVRTSDVYFRTVEQEDTGKLQVFTVSKNVNPVRIQKTLAALDMMTPEAHFSEETNLDRRRSGAAFVLEQSGLLPSSERYLKSILEEPPVATSLGMQWFSSYGSKRHDNWGDKELRERVDALTPKYYEKETEDDIHNERGAKL